MARLFIELEGVKSGPRELNWGVTRVGRGPENDIVIDHPSVSYNHCELQLGLDFLVVRDCGSTNGTFINGAPIREARLEPNQPLRFGQVPVTVEWSQEQVVVPEIQAPKRAASVELGEGVLSCLKHNTLPAVWHCGKCDKYFCHGCIRDVHLVGRAPRRLCPECSAPVEVAPWAQNRKKQTLWGRIKKTLSRTVKVS